MAELGYIQVLRVCQQVCRFCSNPSNGQVLSEAEARSHIDDLVERNYAGVIFTGGEPTLHESLPELVAYARERELHTRIITNGQVLSERPPLSQTLADHGLQVAHVSIHSHRDDVHDLVTATTGALEHARVAVRRLHEAGVQVHLNTVLCHYNADHLHEMVPALYGEFPYIAHHIFNGLDPRMNRASECTDTIPTMAELEVSLNLAMQWLDAEGRSFRVERIPLCYMAEFAHTSTETRKIVKEEERLVRFLDWKGLFRQSEWTFGHRKSEVCGRCSLNGICAGLWEGGSYYDLDELYPVFEDPVPIIERILGRKLQAEEGPERPRAPQD